MKTKLLVIALFFLKIAFSQTTALDPNTLMGLPSGTIAQMNATSTATIGSLLFNTTDQKVYQFTTSGWVATGNVQNAAEVLLVTPIDVNNVVNDPNQQNETTVEEVVQAIAPITSKAARVFYPPSIAIEAGTNGTFELDLYAKYTEQFASPVTGSPDAPGTIPVYQANELYYYITYADPTVFDTSSMSINSDGLLEYTIIGQPINDNSIINVVFVVK